MTHSQSSDEKVKEEELVLAGDKSNVNYSFLLTKRFLEGLKSSSETERELNKSQSLTMELDHPQSRDSVLGKLYFKVKPEFCFESIFQYIFSRFPTLSTLKTW